MKISLIFSQNLILNWVTFALPVLDCLYSFSVAVKLDLPSYSSISSSSLANLSDNLFSFFNKGTVMCLISQYDVSSLRKIWAYFCSCSQLHAHIKFSIFWCQQSSFRSEFARCFRGIAIANSWQSIYNMSKSQCTNIELILAYLRIGNTSLLPSFVTTLASH